MIRTKLYTYKNSAEFNVYYEKKFSEGLVIQPFIFQETGELLETDSSCIIDITSLVLYLSTNPNDANPALNNLKYADETTIFIVKEEYLEQAFETLYIMFDDSESINLLDVPREIEALDRTNKTFPFKRHTLYHYNTEQLIFIIEHCDEQGIPFLNISEIGKLGDEFSAQVEEAPYFVDITTLINASIDNKNLLYLAEQLLFNKSEAMIVINGSVKEVALTNLPLSFKNSISITELIEIPVNSTPTNINSVKKVIDIPNTELEDFFNHVKSELIGHEYFKTRFASLIKTFRLLNSLNEKRVSSLFLLGPTGVGKTEFANVVGEYMCPSTSIVRINFGNYSSQDALNSLIGSPRGFVGSTEGELNKKLNSNKVGIILCDEFEKAQKNIINFFLELLDTGSFTDSQGTEHDLNGYLIIFTSNLAMTSFQEKIPPEFTSRVDLICEFDLLTKMEKEIFVERYISQLVKKVETKTSTTLTEEDIEKLSSVDIYKINNIRDIKRYIINELQEILESKAGPLSF